VGENAELIRRFYEALDRHDGEAMASAYAPEGSFRDPVFGELSGEEAGDMWRLLTGRSEDLSVELAGHRAEGDAGSAHWIATYTFTPTGRRVVNDIRARLRFRDGRIIEHEDSFSFWRWARQAMGPLGWALGWGPLRPVVSRRARDDLARFRAERAG
jgi:ketosteroid isomerase-like protein